MADPVRKSPEFPEGTDPKLIDPRYPAGMTDASGSTRDPRRAEPRDTVDNRTVVQGRGAGNGAIIAAIVLALAIIAYFLFVPNTAQSPAPGEPAATTEPAPATPPATQPDATTPATPAPAPTDQAPAAPPAAPAPAGQAPANQAPAPAN